MGLFDSIVKGVNKISTEFDEYYNKAMEWDAYRISKRIRETSRAVQRTAYAKALKEQCEGMDDGELIRLMEDLRDERNGFAMNVVANVLVDRGVLYRDEDGKLHRN